MSRARPACKRCGCPHPSRSAPASPKPCSARHREAHPHPTRPLPLATAKGAPARGGGGPSVAPPRGAHPHRLNIAVAALLLGCTPAAPGRSSSAPARATSTASLALQHPSDACTLPAGPDGWASVAAEPSPTAAGRDAPRPPATTGGARADRAHVFDVRTREQLIRALQPDAVFAPDGSFRSERGPDPTPKIIFVHGSISLGTSLAGVELGEADYACAGYDVARYRAAYDPREYNRQPLVDGKPPPLAECAGGLPTQEGLRACSSRRQRRVVVVHVGSNTSLLGVGTDAAIVHGTLALAPPPAPEDPSLDMPDCGTASPRAPRDAAASTSTGPENIIIRNLRFSDAFDFFPSWDPRDAYEPPPPVADPASRHPRCQATLDAARGLGPHECPGGRWNSAYDNLSVLRARHVWIDHSSFDDGERDDTKFPPVWAAPYASSPSFVVQHHDGLLDITGDSDFVTVSYNVFRDHEKTTLVGGSDSPRPGNGLGALRVSFHHNYYENAGQRMPRVRFGKVHIYANYVAGTLLPRVERQDGPLVHGVTYGMGIGYLAKIYAENNVYELRALPGEPAPDASALYRLLYEAAPAGGSPERGERTSFHARGNTLNGEAVDLLSHARAAAARIGSPRLPLLSTDEVWKPSSAYPYTLPSAADVKAQVLAQAGVCGEGLRRAAPSIEPREPR